MTDIKIYKTLTVPDASIDLFKLITENEKMRKCLQEMADEDFRGNRNPLSVKAYHLLEELKK